MNPFLESASGDDQGRRRAILRMLRPAETALMRALKLADKEFFRTNNEREHIAKYRAAFIRTSNIATAAIASVFENRNNIDGFQPDITLFADEQAKITAETAQQNIKWEELIAALLLLLTLLAGKGGEEWRRREIRINAVLRTSTADFLEMTREERTLHLILMTETTDEITAQLPQDEQNLVRLRREAVRREEAIGEKSDRRRKRVALTQIHQTAMAAATFIATRSGATAKKWVALLDEKTRAAHRAANGQKVTIDRAFRVAGEILRFPGDPNGSPSNIINCRCIVLFS